MRNQEHKNSKKTKAELKKMIKVGGKKYETLEDLYKDKVKQLFSYVRAIIEELINDPKLVSFLKNN